MTRSAHHDDLIADCRKRIDSWNSDSYGMKYPSIALTVPHVATGRQIRLCKTHGPYSEVYANHRAGCGSTGYWDARKVLRFLESADS